MAFVSSDCYGICMVNTQNNVHNLVDFWGVFLVQSVESARLVFIYDMKDSVRSSHYMPLIVDIQRLLLALWVVVLY